MNNQLKTLTKMLINEGAGWSNKGDKTDKQKSNKVIIIFMLLIIIPLALAFGFLSFYLTFLLKNTGNQQTVLNMGIGIAGITMLFFGFLMIPNIFYFSDDLQYLLPLPIKPINIINAKLISTWIWENFTAVFVFIPIMIGYAIATPVTLSYWIYGFIIMLTLSIIPTLYGVIINILLVRFTSFGNNKRMMSYIMSISSILLSVGLSIYLLNYLTTSNGNIFYTLAISGNSVTSVLIKIFPFINYASDLMITGNIINLFHYFMYIIIFLTIYYIIAKLFYFDGLMKLNTNNIKKRHINKAYLIKRSKQRTQFFSLVKKEITNLFINSSFFSACISSNFLIPLLILFLPTTNMWVNIVEYINSINYVDKNYIYLFIIIILSILPAGMNFIAPTSISREGSDYQYMKNFPIDYSIQLFSKLFSSILLSTISSLISLVLILNYLQINYEIIIIGFIIGLLSSIIISMVGLLIDLYNPNISWVEEQKAVKENFNGVITLFITIVIPFIYYAFIKYINQDFYLMLFILINILVIITGLLYIKLKYYCEKYFDKI